MYQGNQIVGATTDDELNWLYNIASMYNNVVEIGSDLGRSAHALCSGCKEGLVTCVDKWDDNAEWLAGHHAGWDITIPGAGEKAYKEFQENMKYFRNLIVLRMTSVEASKMIADGTVGMVWIDADHSYLSVKEDSSMWLPKVRPGGIICGHDYSDNWPGVKKAIDETIVRYDVVPGTSIWWKRIN